MKRIYAAAFLILCLASSACAQNHVTLYGIVDSGLTYISNQGGHSALIEDTGVSQPSRWGITGVEELGNGVKAKFVLENGFTLGNGMLGQGGAMFGRTAIMALSSRLGTLSLGRQYDFMYDNIVLDTSGARFAGAYGFQALDIDRLACEQINNAIKYLSPSFDGLTAGAMFGFSNVAGEFGGTKGAPRFISFGLNFDRGGPFSVGAGYTDSNGAGGSVAEAALAATAMRNIGIGARYRFGTLTVFGNYTNNRVSGLANNTAIVVQALEAGVDKFITATTAIGFAYIYDHYPSAQLNQINAAIHYYLSKRTDVYASASFQHSNSASQPAGLFLIVNPATNVGYSSGQNQLALRIGFITHF